MRSGVAITANVGDGLRRLTGATYSGAYTYTFAYAYDAVGNRTVQTQTITSTLVTTYTYDAADRLTSVNGQAYTWDNNGNLLNDGNRTYTYDQANRLTSISGPDLTWSAVYNGDGVRLKQIANGAVTTYTLDYAAGHRILAEASAQGTTVYLYGYECLGEYANDAWLYYLNTAAGYVRQTTDASAQIVSAWVFSPDGLVLVGPQGTMSHLVCGGVYDWATGLIYRHGRYFDPTLGIWLGLAPLVVIKSWQGRRKQRRSRWYLLLLLLVCVSSALAACVESPLPDCYTPFGPPLGDNAIFADPPLPNYPQAKNWTSDEMSIVGTTFTDVIVNSYGSQTGFGSWSMALTQFGVSTSSPIQLIRETESAPGDTDTRARADRPYIRVYDPWFIMGADVRRSNMVHEMAHYWDQANDHRLSSGMKSWVNWGQTAKDWGTRNDLEDWASAVEVYFWFERPIEEGREWTDDNGAGLIRAMNDYGATGPDQLMLDATTLQASATGTIPVQDRYDFLQWKFTGTWK